MQKQQPNQQILQHSSQQFQQLPESEPMSPQMSLTLLITSINQTCKSSIRKLNQVATNIAYKAKHSSCPFINRKQIVLKAGGEPAYLLGKRYECYGNQDEEQDRRFYQDFHSIIWICYRAEDESKFGDVGWGCMIRVCQMVLAQALKKCHPHQHNSQIIKQFYSSPQSSFSFDKICYQGDIMRRWTSSPQILIVMQDLLKKQNKFRLKIQMYNIQTTIQDVGEQNNYPLLVVISNRLGVKKIQQKLVDHIKSLLQHKNSIGIISAIGGQAIYIVGYHQDQFIVLDPHYVQSQGEGEKIYYNQVPRGITLQKMVPSIGFCFYFQNRNQHIKWVQDLAQSYYYYRPNIVVQCDQQFSKKIYQQRHPQKSSNQDQDIFQILQ